VSYSRTNQTAIEIVESDLLLLGFGILAVGILGYLVYEKVSSATSSAAQAVQQALPSVPSIPWPGQDVPYTGPPASELDPNTPGGYP
jgi:hypothetical protein